jgi:hypothetical protein
LTHLGLRILLVLLALPAVALPWRIRVWAGTEQSAGRGGPLRRDTVPAAVGRPDLGAIGLRNLFRAARSPTSMHYSEVPVRPAPTQVPQRPPKPTIALAGIVGGPIAAVVLEGLPGLEGARVLTAGDSAAGIRVLRITRSLVTLRGFDTVWNLGVRQPW